MSKAETAYGPFLSKLFDKPDCDLMPYCAVCGAPASDRHHVIQKGMGGVSKETEKRIPKMRLCGHGNTGGCHGAIHQQRLHVYWEDKDDEGWVFLFTEKPMGHAECWEMNRASYVQVPGWAEQLRGEMHIFGRKR